MGTLAVVFLRATPRGSIAGARMHNSSIDQLDYKGYIEIVDHRPEASQCEAGSGRVCFRVGVATSALLERVVASTAPSASSEPTTGPSDTSSSPEPTSGATAGS